MEPSKYWIRHGAGTRDIDLVLEGHSLNILPSVNKRSNDGTPNEDEEFGMRTFELCNPIALIYSGQYK